MGIKESALAGSSSNSSLGARLLTAGAGAAWLSVNLTFLIVPVPWKFFFNVREERRSSSSSCNTMKPSPSTTALGTKLQPTDLDSNHSNCSNFTMCFPLVFCSFKASIEVLILFRVGFSVWYERRVQSHRSVYEYPVFPTPFTGRNCLFPFLCSWHLY